MPVLAGSLLFLTLLWGGWSSSECQAKGTYEPPHTGFEDPNERPKLKGNPGAGALIDAYGFPISPDEGQDVQKRKRLHPGRMAVTAKRKSVLSPTPMITGLSGRFSER